MGRTLAVTYEQAAAAAEQLQAEGLSPTAKLIRAKLGDAGSLGTIQKYLVEWRSGRAGPTALSRILPPEIQRSIFKFLDEEVFRTHSELVQELEQARREAAELANDNEKLAGLIQQLRTELAEQAMLKTMQEGHTARLLDELRTAREETAMERRQAEQARLDLAGLQPRFEAQAAIENELRELRARFELQREACVQAEQSAAVLKAQKHILDERVAELTKAASAMGHPHGAGGDESDGKSTKRTLQGSSRRGRTTETPGSTATPEPEAASASTAAAAADSADPRQTRLC